MPTIKPLNGNIPSYKRTQNYIMPPKFDNKVKPHEIFEGMKKSKSLTRRKKTTKKKY